MTNISGICIAMIFNLSILIYNFFKKKEAPICVYGSSLNINNDAEGEKSSMTIL
jgi:hypothetical protein